MPRRLTLQGGVAHGGDSGNGGGGLGAGGAIFNQGTLVLSGVTLANDAAVGGSSEASRRPTVAPTPTPV